MPNHEGSQKPPMSLWRETDHWPPHRPLTTPPIFTSENASATSKNLNRKSSFSPYLSPLRHTNGARVAVVQREELTPCLTTIISYDQAPMKRKSISNLPTFLLTRSDYHLHHHHLKTLICSQSSHYDLEISYEFPTARSKVNLPT